MKKTLINIALILVFLVGLSLLLYPTVSDWWNSFHQSRAIANYTEQMANMDESTYQDILSSARAYNAALAGQGAHWVLTEAELEEYERQLDPTGNGIMGYIEIPKLRSTLPIYHGTSEAVLTVGVGHLEGSSLPVGGGSTHTVLSGHRGLPSARLFTDLDQMEVGDLFTLCVLGDTLTYEVDQILIVLPSETGALAIEDGQDYCTLVTCTPYGVNTHRLLVRGRRVENQSQAASVRVTSEAVQIEPLLVAPIVAAPMLLALMVWLLVGGRRKKRRR